MQIYLAKPGSEKKGPFTLDQINRDLAARIYRDDAYWAWHEGLPEWVPLHCIPGISMGGLKKAGPALPPVPVVRPPKPGEHLIQRVTTATPITETTGTTIVTPPPAGYRPLAPDPGDKKNGVPAPAVSTTKEQDVFVKRPADPAPVKETKATTLVASKAEELLAHMQPVPDAAAKKNSVVAPGALQMDEPDIFFKRADQTPNKNTPAGISMASKPAEPAVPVQLTAEVSAKKNVVTAPVALAEPDIFFKRAADVKPDREAAAPLATASKEAPVQPAPDAAKKNSVTMPVALSEPDIFFKRAADVKTPSAPQMTIAQPQQPAASAPSVPEVKQDKPPVAAAPVVAEPKEEVLFKRTPKITDSTGTTLPDSPPETPSAPAKPALDLKTKGKAKAEETEVYLQTAPEPAAAPAAAGLAKTQTAKAVASGLPFASLEQIFVFTTGKGRPLFESALFKQKVHAVVGEPLNVIRAKVPVDVIGHMDLRVEETLEEGAIPDQAMRTMSMVRPFVAGRAKEGLYHVCIRVLLAETNDVVTLFMFYSKAKKK